MTPAARVSAAIALLDEIIAGAPAEQQLTRWARANRYAGSKDRAAIRDIVFDALRCQRSHSWLGGAGEAPTGRALILGGLREAGRDPAEIFTGERYAPDPLTAEETLSGQELEEAPRGVRLDCPDWLLPLFDDALGADADAVLELMRHRAPVFLRANLARASRDEVVEMLARDEITATPHPLSPSALEVTRNARRVAHSAAFAQGLVEPQDAASQAIVDLLPLSSGIRVLDYCAGGGGKLLAMGAKADLHLTAHDIDARRMSDIPVRAARAGLADVEIAKPGEPGTGYDLVLCDAPCSGSGAWRRSPQAKWQLTPARLDDLVGLQADILDQAASLVAPGGTLAYATCSLLTGENAAQVDAFLARAPGWTAGPTRALTPLDGGDGFFVAILTRD